MYWCIIVVVIEDYGMNKLSEVIIYYYIN